MNTHAILGAHKMFDNLGISESIYRLVLKISSGYSSVTDLIKLWQVRARDRQLIADMAPRMLQDIGLDSVIAHEEANKPFWRK